MKVLVTGAGGFFGGAVVERLLKAGHGVRALIRPAASEPKWSAPVDFVRADLRNAKMLETAFDGIDAVIHVAAATSGSEDAQFVSSVMGTERLLEAMAKTPVKRLIHISSLVVYDWHAAKYVMDETTPLLTGMYDMGAYTIAKIWQERVVARFAAANGFEVTVLRPGFIWGKGHTDIAGMGRRMGAVSLMIGPFTRLPLTHVANCADATVAALEAPAARGQTFNVIDSDDVTVWRYARASARHTGKGRIPLPMPYTLGHGVAMLATAVSKRIYGPKGKLPSILVARKFETQFKPLRFSNSKLKSLIGWTPPLSFEQALEASYGT